MGANFGAESAKIGDMSENGKPRFRLRLRTLLLLIVVAIVAWSGYSYWSDYRVHAARKAREMMAPAVGAQCIVVFGGDDIGRDGGVNHGLLQGLLNHGLLNPDTVDGLENAVRGKFVKLNDEWIVLMANDDQGQLWIPRASVFLMRETL